MTKRQIKKAIETKNQDLEYVNARLNRAYATNGASLDDVEEWNGLHDQAETLEQSIRSLELDLMRCGWSAQDYTMSNMIAMNID